MKLKKIKRLPRVRSFEYLYDYLDGIKLNLDEKEIRLKLIEKKKQFEIQKLEAIGRSKAFSNKVTVAKYLIVECRLLSNYLEYINNVYGRITISNQGLELLEKDLIERKEDLSSKYINKFYFAEYFFNILISYKNPEFILPIKKDNITFKTIAQKQQLHMDQTNYEIVRDSFNYFDFINWFTFIKDNIRYHKIYSTITPLKTKHKINRHKMTLGYKNILYQPNSEKLDIFQTILWNKYLELANYVPRVPILYSIIRDKVCYELKMPDTEFDKNLRILHDEPSELTIIPSKGSVPYSRNLNTFFKSLPPKIDNKYVVYLYMDVKKK